MPTSDIPLPTPLATAAPRPRRTEVLGLVGWLLACFAASAIGAIAVARSLNDWYLALRKPAWNPPNWVFGPVWTTLYTMMAVSAWLVWRRRAEQPRETAVALSVFVAQLVLNAFWSWLFFGWRLPGLAFVEVVALWIAIAITIERSYRVSRPAALLLIPYLGWVTFASALNGSIWYLNR
jgi:tryptophan-rich sensory protein